MPALADEPARLICAFHWSFSVKTAVLKVSPGVYGTALVKSKHFRRFYQDSPPLVRKGDQSLPESLMAVSILAMIE